MEIKQQLEKYLAQRLSEVEGLPKFYPAKGGNEDDVKALQGEMEPPFGIVAINEGEEIATGSNVYRLEGTIVLISHIEDTGGSEHSQWLSDMKVKLDEVEVGCRDHALVPSGFYLALHGIDFAGNSSKDSQEDKAHADAITFTAGATQLPQLTP